MKMTIEERAKEYAHEVDQYSQDLVQGYCAGAVSQREIDIEKACYLFKELKEWNAMYDGDFDKAVDAFRKAMEE